MKKFVSLTVALMISGVCCVVAAYFCHFYYTRYQNTVTRLESRIDSFDMRLATLEAHKARELRPLDISGEISTTDRPADEHILGYQTSEKPVDGSFEAISAKGGEFIFPEVRLPVGSTTDHQFDIHIDKRFGTVAGAWFSHAEPYQDLAGFEHFRVYWPGKTNIVRLFVRAKSDASIKMRFEIVVLCVH